jgi:molecular chaperone DnaK (HSP70)
MRLGIDFGTTRTVVAVADRGNYPIVTFEGTDGDTRTWYPSLVAVQNDGQLLFALDAEAQRDNPDTVFLRSFKRQLGEAAPDSPIKIGPSAVPPLELLTGFLRKLREDLLTRSNLDMSPGEHLEVFIAVPANANGNQRFVTLEAFRRAGFSVIGMMNEPSAAGIEFAHQFGSKYPARRENLVVYDLGGGTFDASVIALRGATYEVLSTDGIARLGGDDFDEVLMGLVLTRLGGTPPPLAAEYRLLEMCRQEKEHLNPNSRRISIDTANLGAYGWGGGRPEQVSIPVSEFYEGCQSLVKQTFEALEAAVFSSLGEHADPWDQVTALYLVGGSSDLPIIGRVLRERHGRRVRRSPYPYAATAIGLSIAAANFGNCSLAETFSRHFGVWREADSGSKVVFDPIFARNTPLPVGKEQELVATRLYRPAHNVGCFRYLECSRVDSQGRPSGDVTPWDSVVFPFEPNLQLPDRDGSFDVHRKPSLEAHVIEEIYRCDSNGIIGVTIKDQTTGYARSYRLRAGLEDTRTSRTSTTRQQV